MEDYPEVVAARQYYEWYQGVEQRLLLQDILGSNPLYEYNRQAADSSRERNINR